MNLTFESQGSLSFFCLMVFLLFQIGTPLEEDLVSWGHHSDPSTVPDSILQSSAGDEVGTQQTSLSISLESGSLGFESSLYCSTLSDLYS
jgi:hypothetical protein